MQSSINITCYITNHNSGQKIYNMTKETNFLTNHLITAKLGITVFKVSFFFLQKIKYFLSSY